MKKSNESRCNERLGAGVAAPVTLSAPGKKSSRCAKSGALMIASASGSRAIALTIVGGNVRRGFSPHFASIKSSPGAMVRRVGFSDVQTQVLETGLPVCYASINSLFPSRAHLYRVDVNPATYAIGTRRRRPTGGQPTPVINVKNNMKSQFQKIKLITANDSIESNASAS